MRYALSFMTVASLFLACTFEGKAQFDVSNEISRARVLFAMDRSLKGVARDLKSGAKYQDTVQLINAIDIVVENDWNIYGVRAELIRKKRRIVFPMGFLLAIVPLNIAVAEALTDQSEKPYVFNYFRNFADFLKAQDVAVRTGQPYFHFRITAGFVASRTNIASSTVKIRCYFRY